MTTLTSVELGAVGRYIDLGSSVALDDLGSCTFLTYCRPTTVGENNFGYLFGKTPSGSLNGPRFFVGNPLYVSVGAHSSTAGAPSRASGNSVFALNAWAHIASTFDGTITAANIKHYVGAGADLAEVASYGTTTNGSGSIASDASNNAFLLNRAGLARAFVGDVAYVAVWDRVLSPAELVTAQNSGPLDVPSGLVLLWANQQDLGPNAITPAGRSTFVAGSLPPNTNLGSGGGSAQDLAGVAVAVATATATLDFAGSVDLAGDAVAVATASGSASNSVNLSGDASAQASASGSLEAVVTISAPERSTLLLASCTVTPSGLTPTIALANRWASDENALGSRAMYGKVDGVLGMTPQFKLSRTNVEGTIETSKKFVFSYDGLTWAEFDNRSNDASYFYFSHNSAFSGGSVWIASQTPWLPSYTLPWIESLESSGYVSEAPSSLGASYQFNTRVACVDELGGAIPALPLYSFKISAPGLAPDGTAKRKMVLLSGVHSSEDISNYVLKGAVDFLVSADSLAATVRAWFDVFVYPMVGASGRYGGGTRTDFQSGYVDGDLNRHWHDATHDALNKHKTAIQADCGDTFQVLLDFHGMHNSTNPYNFVQAESDTATWQPAIQAYRVGLPMTSWNTAGTSNYWASNSKGVDISVTPEFPFYNGRTMADTLDYGADHMRAVADIAAAGYWVALDGAAAAQATASGAITKSIPLAAAGLSVATAAGTMSISIPLVGAATTQVSASGDLSVSATGAANLAGAATATANATGGLSLSIPLSGSAVAQALAKAGIVVGKALSGSAIADALATAALNLGVSLSGNASATADAVGGLETAGLVNLSGDAIAQAVASAALTQGVPLSGAAIATAVAAAGLSNGISLSGQAAAEVFAEAGLALSTALAASAVAEATATGGMTINVSLSGAAISEAAASANLTAIGGASLAGNAAANASAFAALTHDVPLSGASLAVSSASGNLIQLVSLSGAAASASMATGGLDVSVQLSGSALVQALAAADLTHIIDTGLVGAAQAEAMAQGSVTLRVNLDGAAVAQAIAAGALRAEGLLTTAEKAWTIGATRRDWTIDQPARNWRVQR